MAPSEIETVDFGWWAAEREPEADQDLLYVETAQKPAFENPRNQIILGRKGGGKTSLQMAFARHYLVRWDYHFGIVADDINFGPLVATYRTAEEAVLDLVNLAKAMSGVWTYGFVVGMMKEVIKSGVSLPKCAELVTNRGLTEKPVWEVITDRVCHLCEILSLLTAEDFADARAVERFPGDDKKFVEAKAELWEFLEAKQGVLITFDGIDRYFERAGKDRWVDKDERSAMRFAVEGLLNAVYGLAEISGAVQFKVLIPEDKVHAIMHRDKDKLKQLFCRMAWRREELVELIARRIAHSLDIRTADGGLETNPAKTWHKVFPRVVHNSRNGEPERIEDYLIRHTHHKPRDLQIFCDQIRDLAVSSGGIATEEIVKRAVADKTGDLVSNLIDEFQFEYPFIRDLIGVFGNARNRLDFAADVGPRINDIKGKVEKDFGELVRIAYDIGLLGGLMRSIPRENDRVPHRRMGGQDYWFFFSYVAEHFDIMKADEVVIHPMFNERLSLTVDAELIIGHRSGG